MLGFKQVQVCDQTFGTPTFKPAPIITQLHVMLLALIFFQNSLHRLLCIYGNGFFGGGSE